MSDFSVMENTMVKPFATLISCRDTIYGECNRGLSLEQCIQECRENPLCACGYYLEPSDTREKSYCAPLNSVLLKNMNLMWNIYDVKNDPTKDLWKRTAVFYRPNIYPLTETEDQKNTVLMQRDIMTICYYSNATKKQYFLQEDLTWMHKGEDIGLKVLFIDKFPQFYELANNIQDQSNFILKIFARPEVIAIVDNKLKKVPYLSVDPTKKIPDTYIHFDGPPKDPNIIQYTVLTLDKTFQIMTDNTKSFLGLKKIPKKGNSIELEAIPWKGNPKEFTGYFQVFRKDLQPNIYKVSEILPARLTFLENSVLPYKQPPGPKWPTILMIVCIILLIVMMVMYMKYLRDQN